MIELNPSKMQTAIAKARKVRCHVRPVAWRKYEVRTPQGTLYVVTFDVVAGRKYATCTCKAGENGNVCYHVAASAQAHCLIAAMKAERDPLCLPDPPAAAAKHEYTDEEIDAIFDRCRESKSSVQDVPALQLASRAAGRPAFGIVGTLNKSGATVKPSWRQLTAIKGMCATLDLDAEAESQKRFRCNLDGLTTREANRFIEALKEESVGPKAAALVLVKPQPSSIGRIGGLEI